jgi:predicted nuclease of predicted toxin-antitoxin system
VAKKILLDQNLPANVEAELGKFRYRMEFTRDVVQGGEAAGDIDILQYAAEKRWHLVTGDADFADYRRYPCNDPRYGHRTLLSLSTETYRSGEFLRRAWALVGWDVVVQAPLIVVTSHTVVVYQCDGQRFVEHMRMALN